jgi:flagellar basal body-associated protein FliL
MYMDINQIPGVSEAPEDKNKKVIKLLISIIAILALIIIIGGIWKLSPEREDKMENPAYLDFGTPSYEESKEEHKELDILDEQNYTESSEVHYESEDGIHDEVIVDDVVGLYKEYDLIQEEVETSEEIQDIITPLLIKKVYQKDGKWWADVDFVTKVSALDHVKHKINSGKCTIPGMMKDEIVEYATSTLKNHVGIDNLLVTNCGYDGASLWYSDGPAYLFLNLNSRIRSYPFVESFNGLQKHNEECGGVHSELPPSSIKQTIDEHVPYSFDMYDVEWSGYFKDSVIIEDGEIKKFDGPASCPG